MTKDLDFPIYRALVTYSSVNTGEIRVLIPSLSGLSSETTISFIGRSATSGIWTVPAVGTQIVVTADDHTFTNIFWVQVQPTEVATAVPVGVPVGVINPYAGSAAPSGWLLCYGQAVSRTTYAALFAVLSTTYNIGSVAVTDFCLPDLRGRAVAGVDNMGGVDATRLSTANTLGTTTGTETVTLTTAQIPAHAHANALTNPAVASGAGTSHNHGTTLTGTTTFAADGHSHAGQGNLAAAIGATSSNIAAIGYVAGSNTGGPSTATYTITGGVGSAGQTFNHYTPVYGSTGGNSSSASVGVTNTAEQAHTHSVTSNVSISNVNAGGDGAHNNMPPTMVLNYIIKAL